MNNTDLQLVLARLYRSEINCSISTLWDGGWDVKLGAGQNGWKAETTVSCPVDDPSKKRSVEEVTRGLAVVAGWLDEKAREHYPQSEYALFPYCCVIDCPEEASFEVVTVRDGGRIAGPDPYSDYTHSCDAHVGELLGHQPNAVSPEEIHWHVRPLVAATSVGVEEIQDHLQSVVGEQELP